MNRKKAALRVVIKRTWPGIVLAAISIIMALGLDTLVGWGWLLTAGFLLFGTALMLAGLSAFANDRPTTWGGGFWSIYTEMSGREAAGGGPSDMTRPAFGTDSRLIWIALPVFSAGLGVISIGILT